MRKILNSTYISLNGVIEDPQLWSMDYFDEDAARYANDLLFSADALLLGRATYESFAEAWPSRSDAFADRINAMKKYVVTRTLTDPLEWNNSMIIRENIIDEIRKLKEQSGDDILMYGAGQLAHMLLQHDLIDELRLWYIPVVQDQGERLFDGLSKLSLELLSVQRLPSGTVILTYGPAGTRG